MYFSSLGSPSKSSFPVSFLAYLNSLFLILEKINIEWNNDNILYFHVWLRNHSSSPRVIRRLYSTRLCLPLPSSFLDIQISCPSTTLFMQTLVSVLDIHPQPVLSAWITSWLLMTVFLLPGMPSPSEHIIQSLTWVVHLLFVAFPNLPSQNHTCTSVPLKHSVIHQTAS